MTQTQEKAETLAALQEQLAQVTEPGESQAKLAERAGISVSLLGRILRGTVLPETSTIARMVQNLNLNLNLNPCAILRHDAATDPAPVSLMDAVLLSERQSPEAAVHDVLAAQLATAQALVDAPGTNAIARRCARQLAASLEAALAEVAASELWGEDFNQVEQTTC